MNRGKPPRAALLGLLTLALLRPLQPWHALAQGVPDRRFGVVESYAAPAAATALGAGWTRITFEWNRIQPNGPDEWNPWPVSDDIVNQELAQGREVVAVLNTTPGWATDTAAGAGVPKGLHLPIDDPNNLWAGYVRTMVTRYAGRIDHWTIWNEPDIPTSSADMSWGGSIDDFLRLLQVGYQVAQQANPNAVIHLAAITHHHDQHWFGRFLEKLVADPSASANNYYFDVATLHLYHEPEKIYDITAHYAAMLRGHDIHKPIWIAETNAYLSRISPAEQAFFIFQAFSVEIAAGAERIAVYKMSDTETDRAADPEPFGLLQADGTRRPAFKAYQIATTYLSGFRGGTWDRRDDIALVTVDRGDRTTTVVWARTPEVQTAMIPARKTKALLVDVGGGARTVYPERGYYYVNLPGARCNEGCQIGGEPFMLVEDAPAAAATAPTPHTASATPIQTPESAVSIASQAVETVPPSNALTRASEGTATIPIAETPSPTLTPSPAATPTATALPSPTIRPTMTPTAMATPTCLPSATATPFSPPTVRPPATPAATISHRSISLARSHGSRNQTWILVGVLLFSLTGAACSAGRSRL
mgnify:CR=1 FL=1